MIERHSGRNVRVARIGKPHGIRGEVTAEVYTDTPNTRFAVGNVLTVFTPEGSQADFPLLTVEKARWNKNILLLKFAEFSDRNTAESLRDTELYASAAEPIDEDEGWYAGDLIGMDVFESNYESSKLGKVTNLITRDPQDLLELRLSDGREVLIPFVEEIVPEIDEERGAIIITPPPGLLELNQD